MKKRLLYIINVDWYFYLHWVARAKAAQKAGFEVHIAMQCTRDDICKKIEDMAFKIHPIKLRRKSINILFELKTIKELKKIICDLKPDLIHSVTVKPNLYAGILCKKLGVPQIMSVTGLGIAFSSQTWRAKFAKMFICHSYRHILSNNKKVIIAFENNENCKTFIDMNIATPQQTCVIFGAGVDINEYAYQSTKRNEIFTILFAARMLWDKGLLDLIKAVEILKRNKIYIKLLVAGIIDTDNSNAIPLNIIEKWDKDGMINWLGEIQTGMANLIGSVDLVVLPTAYGEGVPRVLIEAAAVGKPIITTNVAGCSSIVIDGYNGFLVPVRNVNDLVIGIKKLFLSSELCSVMGNNGRSLVETKFSEEIVIRQSLSCYKNMLSNYKN